MFPAMWCYGISILFDEVIAISHELILINQWNIVYFLKYWKKCTQIDPVLLLDRFL